MASKHNTRSREGGLRARVVHLGWPELTLSTLLCTAVIAANAQEGAASGADLGLEQAPAQIASPESLFDMLAPADGAPAPEPDVTRPAGSIISPEELRRSLELPSAQSESGGPTPPSELGLAEDDEAVGFEFTEPVEDESFLDEGPQEEPDPFAPAPEFAGTPETGSEQFPAGFRTEVQLQNATSFAKTLTVFDNNCRTYVLIAKRFRGFHKERLRVCVNTAGFADLTVSRPYGVQKKRYPDLEQGAELRFP